MIGLREGLEASLIVGIIIAYLRKTSRQYLYSKVWVGVGIAAFGALGIGAILTWGPYGLSFQAQEILGGVLSLTASGLVTWMIFWMAGVAKDLKNELHEKLDAAVSGSAVGLVALAFLAVAREGIETALFIWAAAASSGDALLGTLSAFAGILVAIIIGWLIYKGAVRINLSKFFTWTGYFLVIVAAGIVAYGIGDLQEAGVLPGWQDKAFDISAQVPLVSWYGTLLQGFFNFHPNPSWLQVIGWAIYLIVILPLFYIRSRKRNKSETTNPQQKVKEEK